MKIRQYALGLVATLLALPTLADGIDGKWKATVESPQGAMELQLEFKAVAAGKLEGTISAEVMPATPISDGTIKGSEVTFKLSVQFMEGAPPLVINYKGSVKGDELDLTSVMDMGEGPMETKLLAKRAK
jgi:hypothetical protein